MPALRKEFRPSWSSEPGLDCHLLFPPPWSLLSSVHLSLPLLRGHLESRGRRVAQTDLNIAVANRLLCAEFAAWAAEIIETQLTRGGPGLGQDERARKETALAMAPFIVGGIAEACAAVRRAVDVPREAAAAVQVIRLAADLLTTAAFPMSWSPFAGEYRPAEMACDETLPAALAALRRAELDPFETALRAALLEALAGPRARLYALGVACSEQLYPALRCATWIREEVPDARIVLGGAAVPFLLRTIAAAPVLFDLVDFVVAGDGEEPLQELLTALEGKLALAEVPNLRFRAEGRVRASACGMLGSSRQRRPASRISTSRPTSLARRCRCWPAGAATGTAARSAPSPTTSGRPSDRPGLRT